MPAAIVQVSPAPTGADLDAVYVDPKGTAFVAGAAGTLLKSTDHGATWTAIATKTTADIHGLWGTSTDIYAGADGDQILVSNDSGATWRTEAPKTGRTTAIEGGAASTPTDVTAVGVNGVIVHSKDRGTSWVVENTEAMGYQTLYAVAYGAGGKGNVSRIAVGETPSIAEVIDDAWSRGTPYGSGFRAVVTAPKGFIAVGDNGIIRQVRTDGEVRDVRNPIHRGLRGVWRDGTTATLVAVGETAMEQGVVRATAIRSTDGGVDWTPVDAKADHPLAAIAGTARDLWSVGERGTVVRSTDAGATWTPIGTRVLADREVRGVVRAASGKALVAAGGGLARSTDGGKSWTKLRDAGDAFVVVAGGSLVAIEAMRVDRSTDDGATWQKVGDGPKDASLRGVAAVGSTIVAVTSGTKLAISQDAGATWSSQPTPQGATLGAAWAAGNDLWVAGDGSTVLRSPDRGKTWVAVVVKTAKPLALHAGWSDGGKTIAVAGRTPTGGVEPSRGVIAVSSDGGATWIERPIAAHADIAALAGGKGAIVAVGDHGGAVVSRDAGKTWTSLPFATANHQSALWSDGVTVVIGSSHGELWRGGL